MVVFLPINRYTTEILEVRLNFQTSSNGRTYRNSDGWTYIWGVSIGLGELFTGVSILFSLPLIYAFIYLFIFVTISFLAYIWW